MTANQAALINWDESHVGVHDLDLVLPDNAAGPNDGAYDIAVQASASQKPKDAQEGFPGQALSGKPTTGLAAANFAL